MKKELMKQIEMKKIEMEQLDKQLEKLLQKESKEPVNLCPNCSVYCEERFTDGQCK